jgi:hypothetical protein
MKLRLNARPVEAEPPPSVEESALAREKARAEVSGRVSASPRAPKLRNALASPPKSIEISRGLNEGDQGPSHFAIGSDCAVLERMIAVARTLRANGGSFIAAPHFDNSATRFVL